MTDSIYMIHEETHGLLACAPLSFDDVIKFVTDSEVSASNTTVVGLRVASKKAFSVVSMIAHGKVKQE